MSEQDNLENIVSEKKVDLNQVVQPTESINGEPKKSVFWKILISVVVLLVIGGVSVSAYLGYNPFSFKNETIKIGEAIIRTTEDLYSRKIKSIEQSGLITVSVFDLSDDYSKSSNNEGGIDDWISSVRGIDAKLEYNTNIVNEVDDLKLEGDLTISLTGNNSSLSMFGPQELKFKYKVFSDFIFINVQTFPNLLSIWTMGVDTDKYLNKWISFPVQETSNQMTSFYSISTSTFVISENQKGYILDLFDNSEVFKIIKQKSEKTENGTDVSRVSVKVNWVELANLIISLSEKYNLTEKISPEDSAEFLSISNQIEKYLRNFTLEFIIGNDSYIYGMLSSADIFDDNKKKVGNYKANYKADYNKNLTILKPEDSIGFLELDFFSKD